MYSINSILDLLVGIKPSLTRHAVIEKITPLCGLYLKQQSKIHDVILIISIPNHVPFVLSSDYSAPVYLLGQKVLSAVSDAKRFVNADITVLEWFPAKGVKVPYYRFYDPALACPSPQKSNF